MATMGSLAFGDLILDETCLFAMRQGRKIPFTRNERALLRALLRNPQRLMSRSRLLDEISSPDADRSDRYIDFLVNRLRAKLGDHPRTPVYIGTQYGEGYVWIAAPASAEPIEAMMVIAPTFAPGQAASRQAFTLARQLRDRIAAGIGSGPGADRSIVVAEGWRPNAADRLRYVLQLGFRGGPDSLDCTATFREMPSSRIARAFRLALDIADPASFAAEAERVSQGVIAIVAQAASDLSTGLGISAHQPLEARLHEASNILLAANPRWSDGTDLARHRAQNPGDADLALQWCLHLFARLNDPHPFGGIAAEDRHRIEAEIDATALECLPATEANPLHMFAAAKVLYYIDRGHLDLAEDLAERAFARARDFAAAYALMGQLRYARGQFAEAVRFFDRGIARVDVDAGFRLHLQVLKCVALLAADDRAALHATIGELDSGAPCPAEIRLLMDWAFTPPDRDLPDAAATALAAIGPAAATGAIEYMHFTVARHLVAQEARANVMRGLIARIRQAHGDRAVPAFVARSAGLSVRVRQAL